MKKLIYLIVLPFYWAITLFPISVLYQFSSFLFIIVYHLLGYRKNVVLENLRNAFPEKPSAEINAIAVNYYHYFCDFLVEFLKGASMTRADYEQRWTADAAEVDRIHAQGRSCIFILGHYGNWEGAAPVCTFYSKYRLNIVYKHFSNPDFDKLIKKIRTRFNNKVTPMQSIFRCMVKEKKQLMAYAFVADQSPSPTNAYWMTFLNQDTAVFAGVEQIAQKLNLPVFYISIQCKKRGYYHVQPVLLHENPQQASEGEIIEAYMQNLEKDIINAPQFWLWSHRRWKHKIHE